MDDIEKEPNQVEINEAKSKKPGFFKRLKRRVSSVFQRKPNRKRTKSEPCIPEFNAISQKRDPDTEQRLSLNSGDNQQETDKSGDNCAETDNFRPPTKAPIFVNDFTAELKKSLKIRSQMVEEGQTSNAIFQIEMSRSNYSVSEEESGPAETEKKTFEEKLALFESQISGGSLHNSLNRGEKSGESTTEGEEGDEKDDVEKMETELLEIEGMNESAVESEDAKTDVVNYEMDVCDASQSQLQEQEENNQCEMEKIKANEEDLHQKIDNDEEIAKVDIEKSEEMHEEKKQEISNYEEEHDKIEKDIEDGKIGTEMEENEIIEREAMITEVEEVKEKRESTANVDDFEKLHISDYDIGDNKCDTGNLVDNRNSKSIENDGQHVHNGNGNNVDEAETETEGKRCSRIDADDTHEQSNHDAPAVADQFTNGTTVDNSQVQ